MPKAIEKNKATAVLAALAVFLSSLEYAIPKPLPFLRLGLANVAILLGLLVLDFKHYLWLILVKAIMQAVVSGTLFSYVFLLSAVGSFASGLLMYALAHLPRRPFSLVGISVAGAFASNISQLLLASLLFMGRGVIYVALPFLLGGVLSSAGLGWWANRFALKSQWLQYNRLQE